MFNDPYLIIVSKNKEDPKLWNIKVKYKTFGVNTKTKKYKKLTPTEVRQTKVPYCKIVVPPTGPYPNRYTINKKLKNVNIAHRL